MKNLYAPWRSPYSSSEDAHKDESASPKECVFCKYAQESNEAQYFILKRYKYCYAILNKFPYNAGHLMIIPVNHVKTLNDLPPEALNEIMAVITQATSIVDKQLKSEGINIGLNLGSAAGAGIPSHLHWHILPRWHGDTNFMPTLAGTKVISFDLKDIYQLLKPKF